MLTDQQITPFLDELTKNPWYSWEAHYDQRRRAVYWGSDFIVQVRDTTSLDDIGVALQEYTKSRSAMIDLEYDPSFTNTSNHELVIMPAKGSWVVRCAPCDYRAITYTNRRAVTVAAAHIEKP